MNNHDLETEFDQPVLGVLEETSVDSSSVAPEIRNEECPVGVDNCSWFRCC